LIIVGFEVITVEGLSVAIPLPPVRDLLQLLNVCFLGKSAIVYLGGFVDYRFFIFART
jgi:hypothetical protein